jgi:methionyl-tRNA formyltransferase
MRNIIFADGPVGLEICRWLLANYRDDITCIVTLSENTIFAEAQSAGTRALTYRSESELLATLASDVDAIDWGFLVWWPHIIGEQLIVLPHQGFVNTHPSLLPYNRGKHYNFWALVEQAPFGVSLHMVEEDIDCGDVLAQKLIDYDWEDTGETMYYKALQAMPELFAATYPLIRERRHKLTPQDLTKGSFHFAKELEPASRIDLDAQYVARDFFNLLRARTFSGRTGCSFVEQSGEEYEVYIRIRRKRK